MDPQSKPKAKRNKSTTSTSTHSVQFLNGNSWKKFAICYTFHGTIDAFFLKYTYILGYLLRAINISLSLVVDLCIIFIVFLFGCFVLDFCAKIEQNKESNRSKIHGIVFLLRLRERCSCFVDIMR